MKRISVASVFIATAMVAAEPAWAAVSVNITGNSSPTRAASVYYIAQVQPSGTIVQRFDWEYRTGTVLIGSYSDLDADGDGTSVWGGKMVQDGTLTCRATTSGDPGLGSVVVTITPRPWPVPLSCVTDNEPDWGAAPTAGAALGKNRDRDSDLGYVFVPQNNGDWNAAYSCSSVPSGPCQGLWYVSSSSLKSQRETVINRYIKADGPTLGGQSFAEANSGCFSTSAGAFLEAVWNHEYRGTLPAPKSIEGHYGRLEHYVLDQGHDAKQDIEDCVASSLAALQTSVNETIAGHENEVRTFVDDEEELQQLGGNWGSDDPESLGYGSNARWNEGSSTWTGCVNDPEQF